MRYCVVNFAILVGNEVVHLEVKHVSNLQDYLSKSQSNFHDSAAGHGKSSAMFMTKKYWYGRDLLLLML